MKKGRPCAVCGDSRKVRLPVRMTVTQNPVDLSVSIDDGFKEYPCPECAPYVPIDRVRVLDVHASVREQYLPEAEAHVQRSAAHQLVDHVLRGGFITFERGPRARDPWLDVPMVATMAVVAPGVVATMEQRIAERQDQVAEAVAEEAKRRISIWGRDVGYTHIEKGRAYDSINEALAEVLTNWSKIRALGLTDPDR